MDIKIIQELLAQPESISLEFKSSIDLKGERGKAKFIKEVLSLANMGGDPAYLIIGVDDDSRAIIGFSGYSEIDIQNFMRDWCLPPVDFDFHVVEFYDEKLGVMEIYGDNQLHRIKRALSYADTDGKTKEVRENALFIRRGSRVDEATLEELIAIARQGNPDLREVISKLDDLNDGNDEIIQKSSFRDRGADGQDQFSREVMETIFVSGLSGVILGSLWNSDSYWLPLAALPIAFFCIITTSIFRITHFGVRHTIVAGSILGTLLSVWLAYGFPYAYEHFLIFSVQLLGILFNGFVAGIIGLVAGVMITFWRPLGI